MMLYRIISTMERAQDTCVQTGVSDPLLSVRHPRGQALGGNRYPYFFLIITCVVCKIHVKAD